MVVITALVAVIALSWAYVLAGAGMGTSAFDMTHMLAARDAAEGGMACMTSARSLDARLCRPDVLHVVDDDGGDDAAQRGADDPFVCDGHSQAARHWPSLCRDEPLRVWLSRRAGRLQPGRGDPAVGVRAHRGASPMLVATNAILGGSLLLAAGVYQLTPIKHACLRRCRSPLAFLRTALAAGRPVARYAWALCTALSASAAAGS